MSITIYLLIGTGLVLTAAFILLMRSADKKLKNLKARPKKR